MKNPSIAVLSVFFFCCCLSGTAQSVQKKALPINEPNYNKPKLFGDLPDRVDFNPGKLLNLFDLQIGQSVDIPISASFDFTGEVVSKSDAIRSTTVVIKSTNRLGARLIFTKITDQNNAVKYIGRIISMQHGDSYEIISENNQYYFKKKGIYDLMNE